MRRYYSTLLVAAFVGLIVSHPQSASGISIQCPTVTPEQSAYLLCQIDQPPMPVIDTSTLRDMEYAACSGAEFHLMVGSNGGVRDVAVSDETPGARLCEAFASDWQFEPGVRRGSRVDVRFSARLRYTVPKRADLLWDPAVRWQPSRSGYDLLISWGPADEDVNFASAVLDSALASVVRAVASHGRIDELDHYCVDLGDYASETEAVIFLAGELGQPTFSRTDCPSIIQLEDGSVGYVRDPPYLHVGIRGTVRPASARAMIVDSWYARGLGGAGFRCRAERVGLIWRARCLTIWTA